MENLFDGKTLYMPDMYDDAIKRGKDKTFIVFQRVSGIREEYSFNYIKEQANLLSTKLKEAGLKKGDRIGVVSSLRPWWFSLSYVCLKDGYIMVCIDPGVPAIQMQNMMLQTQIRACFTTLNNIHIPNDLDEHIPVYAIDKDFPLISKCNKVSYLLGNPVKLPEDTFYILFSSGTTGENRKAVLLRHNTVTKGIEYGMSRNTGVFKKTTVYTPSKCDFMLFPPYHIAGLLCATYDIYCNTKIIILERLTPNAMMSAFNDLKPDNICTVPSMLNSLYKKILSNFNGKPLTKLLVNSLLSFNGFLRRSFGINIGRCLFYPINKKAFGGKMRSFMIGASPFDKTANKFFLDMGIDVSMAYGLTELGAPIAATGKGYYPGTTGRVVKHTNDIDIRIVNKDDTGRGEVEILSPYRMISYLMKKDNEGCFTEDGYFKSGDLGYFDSKKCLVICGRSKESIVLRNGEKLLPEEIESKYQEVDCVKEIAAFKIPGEGGCDDFAIAIVKDRDKGIPDEAMKVRVYERADKLPPMYRPKEVYVIKEFPLSSSHKVQRFRLTEMAVKGESEPITDATMIPVDEDEISSELRKILVNVGGPQWKTEKFTQGLLLNLDSLSTVNLYVGVQDKWNIDLFQSSSQPETIGELLDIINNYDVVDKKKKNQLDLSKYPLPASALSKFAGDQVGKLAKQLWHATIENVEILPKDKNYIICSNHRTDIDPAFILSNLPKEIVRKTCVVGKAELVTDKLLKNLVLSHNIIPVDRNGNSIKTLDRCQELLLEGWNVLIFPEGTSVQNHTKMFQLKEGSARLAISTGKPIVTCNVSGVAHQSKEMGAGLTLPSLKSRIKIKFGEVIYPDNKTPQELNELITKSIESMNE